MSDSSVPYREGEEPPSEQHVLAQVQNEDGSLGEKFWVLPDDLEMSTLQHEDIEPLVPMLRWLWRHLGELLTWVPTFEQWEIGFLRDKNPGQEVSMWLSAAYAYLEFLHRNPIADSSPLFEAIVGMLVGKQVEIEPKNIQQEIIELIQDPPDELFEAGNFSEAGMFNTDAEHLR